MDEDDSSDDAMKFKSNGIAAGKLDSTGHSVFQKLESPPISYSAQFQS